MKQYDLQYSSAHHSIQTLKCFHFLDSFAIQYRLILLAIWRSLDALEVERARTGHVMWLKVIPHAGSFHMLCADDPCGDSLCQNGATCVSLGPFEDPTATMNYNCVCPRGHEGALCEIRNSGCISSNPCENGGTCQEIEVGVWEWRVMIGLGAWYPVKHV